MKSNKRNDKERETRNKKKKIFEIFFSFHFFCFQGTPVEFQYGIPKTDSWTRDYLKKFSLDELSRVWK